MFEAVLARIPPGIAPSAWSTSPLAGFVTPTMLTPRKSLGRHTGAAACCRIAIPQVQPDRAIVPQHAFYFSQHINDVTDVTDATAGFSKPRLEGGRNTGLVNDE